MAFQQPQHRPHVSRPLAQPIDTAPRASVSQLRRRSVEESQEWILFSPVQHPDSQSATSQTPRTATHLSEFGSLETHVRSQPIGTSERAHEIADGDDEDAELDSLDDGLHAFHHPVFSSSSNLIDQSGGALLPTHDGLGTFTSASLQETLWQYERHNPRKKHMRRRSSVQKRLDAVENAEEPAPEDEKMARVEKWRLDQSRAVLEEIERETRRRRRRLSRMSGVSGMSASVGILPDVQEGAPASDISSTADIATEPTETGETEEQPSESFWKRLTRRVIRDLIGLDESTLSVLFGEQFIDDRSPTPTQPSPIATAVRQESRVTFSNSASTWESRLLERIARELGLLVHQFTDYPSGAFTTYTTTQPSSLEHAIVDAPRYPPSLRQRRRVERERKTHARAASDSLFTPTIPQQQSHSPTEPADTSLWGIEEEPTAEQEEDRNRAREQQAYWERDADVKMIFSYLKGRFRSSQPADSDPMARDIPATTADGSALPLPASWATDASALTGLGTSPDSLRRAEFIRRQHPLVSRAAERAAAQSKRRESLLRRHHMQTFLQKRTGSSSCASQSTKRSRRSRSASSRHYWDIGGSGVGSGSGAAMSSGLGGWGEV